MFPRRNKAHRYALPSRGHQWWWWWWWWCRTRGEEDVAWPGSKWKLLKPLSPRANERSLSRLPGWDPGRKCQRSTAPNRSIYTKNLPSFPIPCPYANKSCTRVARRIAFSSSFDILRARFLFKLFFIFIFFLSSFFSPFPLFYETESLSLSKKEDRFFSTQEIIPDWGFFFNWNFILIVFILIRNCKLIFYRCYYYIKSIIIRETNGSRTLSFESHFAFCKLIIPPPRDLWNYQEITNRIRSLLYLYSVIMEYNGFTKFSRGNEK